MGSIRQNKIEKVIQEELAQIFQRNARAYCKGAMVTPTVVRVTPDLGIAKIYLSIFAGPSKEEVFEEVNLNRSKIRGEMGRKISNLHHIPDLQFFIDDSLDYAEKIDELLKK